ncbi:MAG TPA: adenylate/guanylate cyclase domain-containing protein [Candidatus Deferrimicrobium sp.]|nr:adenylate/guanylate cyclase domain-containing protein [Candidatus Deferrimicrobium sp.]
MLGCPSCSHENPDGSRFCSRCGAELASDPSSSREERKVVTVLFADLVGFTSRAERLDPEDVRALLAPYYARLRHELERFGGTVEKFIGDAVMALFGAPVAHEDDPERAVRAALAIRDWVLDQPDDLQLRIAVNTGEALVLLDARPGQGEGMAAGDVVNTTSRLQNAAPVNGVLVGEVTYHATSHAIEYAAADAVHAKGKPEPIPVWEALRARSRAAVDRPSGERTPLVGRTYERGVLIDALARVRRDRAPQLVTLVGVPGIGKTRLIAELGDAVDAGGDLIRWRQGRSLPYGEGVGLWALSEIVKSEAGILDSDAPEQVEAKLARSAAAAGIADDAEWVLVHLRPLVGLGTPTHQVADRRGEAFAAWRRFFEGHAERTPLALAFDDLHWANDVLLDFIEHLVEWADGVPLLVICATRPELLARRPGWGGGKRNATTLSLTPLDDEETAAMIRELRGGAEIPPRLRDALLARAGGNPLYAEQYMRMLAERGSADELPLPETLQGIIAARLDALPADEKRLLQNAAIVGRTFWVGLVAVMDGTTPAEAQRILHSLERMDFVRRLRRPSLTSEVEFTFLQILVREVAYSQIPRGHRAAGHRLAADWLSALGPGVDKAEMLAHHYLTALELQRAAGQEVEVELAERTISSLSRAGDQALGLSAYGRAAALYRSAADLAPTAQRGRLMFNVGRAAFLAGDEDPAVLTAAAAALLAEGDRDAAAEAEAILAELSWVRGDQAAASDHLERARQLVEGGDVSRAKAWVMGTVAGQLSSAGENEDAIRVGREALAMAEQLGLDELRARVLNGIGVARVHRGDMSGLADIEASVAIARDANVPYELCRALGNVARVLWEQGRLREGAAAYQEAGDTAAHFGLDGYVRWVRSDQPADHYVLGRWDEALAAADAFIREVEAGSPHYGATASYATRALVRLGRDDVAGARADVGRALEIARLSGDRQNLYPWLAACAHVFHEIGDTGTAAELAGEFLAELQRDGTSMVALDHQHELAWTLTALDRGAELLAALPAFDSPWVRATAAFARSDLAGAADACAVMGALSQEARVRLWFAERLLAQGDTSEAEAQLERARNFYTTVRATRYLRAVAELQSAVRGSQGGELSARSLDSR